jgi:hypothetical protein
MTAAAVVSALQDYLASARKARSSDFRRPVRERIVEMGLRELTYTALVDTRRSCNYAHALNPSTPAETVSRFAVHPSIHVRWQLAIRTDLPQQTYRTLAQDPAPGIRGNIAANPAIGEDLIRTLAGDTAYDVRRRLAHNPAIPLDVLTSLAPTAKMAPPCCRASRRPHLLAVDPPQLVLCCHHHPLGGHDRPVHHGDRL